VTTVFGTSAGVTFTINPPLPPTITSLNPSAVTVGGPDFSLLVAGTSFTTGATVNWNGAPLPTQFVSATMLQAAVSASQVASAGTATVTVVTPNGTSPLATFNIYPKLPTISSLSPNSAKSGGAAFTLTINGTSYVTGAVAKWNGAALTTTFVNATQLTASVPATLIATAGTASVTVTTTGGTSAAATFTINPGVPTITSLSPNSATAGTAAFNMTVTGTNYVLGARVLWNGASLQTIFGGSASLTAVVPAANIATAGTASVKVTTSGGTSNAATFTIKPHPAITSLSPSSAKTGGAGFTLTVNGTGFVSGATVKFGSAALTTTFVSATQLKAAVPSAYISKAATVSVAVVVPGAITSNAVSFTVH